MEVPPPPQTLTGLDTAAILAQNHLNEPLAVSDLAQAAGYSPPHFARLFTRKPLVVGILSISTPEPQALLAPTAPIVGSHAKPITRAGKVHLQFHTAEPVSVPMLPALPAMAAQIDI